MEYNSKITEEDLTFGPWDPDELEMFVLPKHLIDSGYRRVSNAYCHVARIDRDDWLDVLAYKMCCARADFYNKNGTGIGDRWRDHYIRCYSMDVLTISPKLIKKVPSY